MFLIIIFLILILIALALVAWRYGVFDQFKMEDGRLLSCEILYLGYQGDYSKVGPLFQEVSRDCQATFKFSQNFGFYFDDPATTSPQNCHAIVGILVNEGEQFKIREFLAKHPGYSQKRLRTTKYVSYEMPYINILSILLMIKKVYPQINEYLKKRDYDENQMSGMMELYKFLRSDKKIQIIVPLENQQQFRQLHPENKNNQQQQNIGSRNHQNEGFINRNSHNYVNFRESSLVQHRKDE